MEFMPFLVILSVKQSNYHTRLVWSNNNNHANHLQLLLYILLCSNQPVLPKVVRVDCPDY